MWELAEFPLLPRQKSCLVLSVFAVWTELATSGDCRRLKISKQFCPVSKCGVNWVLSCPHPVSNSHATWLPIVTSYLETGSRLVHRCTHTADKTRQNCSVSNILKTVCDCRELSSHRRQDKTRLVLSCRRCELGVTVTITVSFINSWTNVNHITSWQAKDMNTVNTVNTLLEYLTIINFMRAVCMRVFRTVCSVCVTVGSGYRNWCNVVRRILRTPLIITRSVIAMMFSTLHSLFAE